MPELNETAKEIRLFGEKSIREKAYKSKIIQLENEIANLELVARAAITEKQIPEIKPINNRIVADSGVLMDKALKKSEVLLDRRANEFAERLDLHTQKLLLRLDKVFAKRIRTIILFVILFQFLIIGIPILIYHIYNGSFVSKAHVVNNMAFSNVSDDERLKQRLDYIKKALQSQTVYHNQYTVGYVDHFDNNYIIEIELIEAPSDKWALKNLASEIISIFKRYVSSSPAEFSFVLKDKTCCKAVLKGTPKTRTYFTFFDM
ncbi:MAG: hypothetical protein ABIB11_00955 [Candidatus Omnitrophota bacterium]